MNIYNTNARENIPHYEDEVNGGNNGGNQNVRSGSPMTRISERFRSDSLNLF